MPEPRRRRLHPDTTGFKNNLARGSFAVGRDGNNLTLLFTPVPEPGTWALLLTGAVGAGLAMRRETRARDRRWIPFFSTRRWRA